MYRLDIYRFASSTEYEYKFVGNYGAKGEKRAPKQKRTPEDIERQNQYQRTKTVRHLIKANFKEGDYWTTLTYTKDTSRTIQEVSQDVSKFLGHMRYQYKKVDIPCKYIYRIEIGSRGGIHVHIIMNGIPDLDRTIQKYWTHGKAHNELLDDGTYESLADYIVKPPTEQQKKLLKTFDEEAKKLIRYSCSRNLERPIPETGLPFTVLQDRTVSLSVKPIPQASAISVSLPSIRPRWRRSGWPPWIISMISWSETTALP